MQRRSRSVIAVLAVILAVVAGCTVPTFAPNGSGQATAPATTSGPASTGNADWRPCPEVPRQLVGLTAPGMTYDCAKVSVPRDWKNPGNGETYAIAMIRIRSAKQQARIGSLLVNPGGPGGSGVELAVSLSFGEAFGGLPAEITNKFDIIGFDPRGVGRSDPVKCISPANGDASNAAPPDPVSAAEFDQLVALNKTIAADCEVPLPRMNPLPTLAPG